MYGERETSFAPRVTWVVLHLGLFAAATWVLVGDGRAELAARVGWPATPGDAARRAVLVACGALLWVRMTLTALYLLARRFSWSELIPVTFATAVYQVGFALLGVGQDAPLGVVDAAAIALFALGSYLNTASELQRKWFKDDPANRGKLFTGGLFRLARHVNFFGDTLWATAWAVLTHNPWAAPIPIVLTCGFVVFNIPALSRYLRTGYGGQYDDWARHTRAFVPFVY